MTTIVVGCDSSSGYSSNKKWQDTVSSVFRKAGFNVKQLSVGPTPFGSYGYTAAAKGKVGVYIMAASLTSVSDLCPGSSWRFDKTFFILRTDLSRINTEKKFNTWGIHKDPEGDCRNRCCDKWQGKTYPQINSYIASRGEVLFGRGPEDQANLVVSRLNGVQQGFSTNSDGKGGYQSYYNGSLQGNSESSISPLLQGEMTFEELVGEICHGIDLMFLPKRNICVVTDFSTIFAEAKYLRDNNYKSVQNEDISLWQLDEDSYELNIDQHGFYNTVYVYYKNGVVKEQFFDFARTFGEISIKYYDKKIDKTTAQLKAKAYLAAHLRDFEMTVEATILSEPDIDIGDIVTLENPQHRKITTAQGGNAEFLFVKGVNTTWEGEGPIQTDLELQFSPTSPLKKEVPTHGVWGTTDNVSDE